MLNYGDDKFIDEHRGLVMFSDEEYGTPRQAIMEEIGVIRKAIGGKDSSILPAYDTPYGSLTTPFDREEIERCKGLAAEINKQPPSLVVLVGIGGSSVGTLALLQALLPQDACGMNFICADTIDNDSCASQLARIERELKEDRRVLLIIVTKSGTTAETIINGSLFLACLQKYKPASYQNDLVFITDAGSPLEKVALQEKSALLRIPKQAGGRFSIFTAVGLLPLAVMGIDIDAFCSGARDMLESCLSEDLESNDAAKSAAFIADRYAQNYVIHDLFVFSPRLNMLAQWYKQLIGESLGKKHSLQGQLVEIGITPTVSLGTTDLHSVVQLYLAGPRNRVTTFIAYTHEPSAIRVPDNAVSNIISHLPGKEVTAVKQAIFEGVVEAYRKEGRPSQVSHIVYGSSRSMGEFMMAKMVETLFLAAIWKINPFDQPAVELYKQGTRAFSSR